MPLALVGLLRCRLHLTLVSGIFVWGQAAAAGPLKTDVAQASGSLRRAAAATDDTLDVVRLALVDLVPALERILSVGQGADATVSTPLPQPVRAVTASLLRGITYRVEARALPPLARAYYNDARQAAAELAAADTLADVRLPAQTLLQSFSLLATYADALLAVLDKPRATFQPLGTGEDVLDAVNEALQQLSLSEANLQAVRAANGTQGEQLAGFARLELDLGHVLDLIYASEEAGLTIGFELAHASDGLARRLTSVHARLAAAHAILARLGARPPSVGLDAHAEIAPRGSPGAQAELAWTPRGGRAGVAQLRLSVAATPAQKAPGAAPWRLLAQLPPGRSSFVQTYAAMPPVAPLYRLVAVSAFGVESRPVQFRAARIYTALQPPTEVTAAPAAPAPHSPKFYRDVDAVAVRWALSPGDLAGQPAARRQAVQRGWPQVWRYDIWRLAGGRAVHAGHVGAGHDVFIDRPGPALLTVGLVYAVEARPISGIWRRGPGARAHSGQVKFDAQGALKLYAAGAAFLRQPTSFERVWAEQLRDPAQLAQAEAVFLRRSALQRDILLREFWLQASVTRRMKWYDNHWKMLDDDERTALQSQLAEHISARDVPWVHAELFLLDHPELQAAPQAFWALLDEAAQKAAWGTFYARLGATAATYANELRAHGEPRVTAVLDQPVQVATWWQSRDAEEQLRAQAAREAVPAQLRNQRVEALIKSQPHAIGQAMLWPDWQTLSDPERAMWLTQGYQRMPRGLLPAALAWVRWREMSDVQRVAAVRTEVFWQRRLVSALRGALRPADAYLGFHLPLVAGGLLLGGALAGFVRQVRRRAL